MSALPAIQSRGAGAEGGSRGGAPGGHRQIMEANEGIAETHEQLVTVQQALAPGLDAISVGPSINQCAINMDQVMFPVSSDSPSSLLLSFYHCSIVDFLCKGLMS